MADVQFFYIVFSPVIVEKGQQFIVNAKIHSDFIKVKFMLLSKLRFFPVFYTFEAVFMDNFVILVKLH